MTITVSGIVFGLLLLLPPIYILYVFSGKLAPKFILASAKLLIYTGILTAVMYVVCMLDNVLVSVLAALVMAVVAALAVAVLVVPASSAVDSLTVAVLGNLGSSAVAALVDLDSFHRCFDTYFCCSNRDSH